MQYLYNSVIIGKWNMEMHLVTIYSFIPNFLMLIHIFLPGFLNFYDKLKKF